MISLDDVILSLFPPLTTHLKHAVTAAESSHNNGTDEADALDFATQLSSSNLFPYDTVIAVIAVTYCRYTVCYTGESKAERLCWSLLLGYLSLYRYDYWFRAYVHIISFGVFFYDQVGYYYDYYYNNCDASGGTTKGTSKTAAMNGESNADSSSSSSSSSSSIDDLSKQAQVLTIVGSVFLAIGHIVYSFSYPTGTNSFFQSKLYDYCSNNIPLIQTIMTSAKHNMVTLIGYMLPVQDFQNAHDILIQFINPTEFYEKAGHLLFVTFHIQVGMGYLGIEFLRNEQSRKNALVKIEDDVVKHNQTQQDQNQQRQNTATTSNNNNDNDATILKMNGSRANNGYTTDEVGIVVNNDEYDPSAKFRRSAGPFIFFVALPYMVQIVFYGGVNMYAFHCFRDDLHRMIRLNDLFSSGDGNRFVATATSKVSKLSPDSYATNSETVVTTCYDMINRNLFSLPKLMLLPGIVAKQPMLLLQITPLILLSDWIKSTIVASITNEVERINKEVKDLESTRTKVEQYDLKNSELIQRSGRDSVLFTERKWMKLTEEIQDRHVRTSLMVRSKMYFSGLQRHFIMMALVDCALAKLIAIGKIVAADIFVYARAIEDMINFVLMKSRSESELATMQTSIDVLKELKMIWDASEERNLLNCTIVDSSANHGSSSSSSPSSLKIQNLSYTRGSAAVSINDVAISPGVYAVTGANGSGKSTLFRVIMGCNSNTESVDIHDSIEFTAPNTDAGDDGQQPQSYSIQMPSSDVVEITQNFYFPLYSSPFDWIYNIDEEEGSSSKSTKIIAMTTKLENELKSLNFYPKTDDNDNDEEDKLRSDLTSSKDDWFLDLSGGQKSKVELVRKVFLADHCPDVLLVDETFAPLDPESKQLVMAKLKSFCTESIVLVIYHADVKQNNVDAIDNVEDDDDDDQAQQHHEACVESSDFFDHNLHVENGSLILRPVCASEN